MQPTTVGTIYADRTNAFYVLTRDGLASLTPMQAQLLLADPALNAAYPGSSPTPLKVSQAQVTEAAPEPLPAPAGAPLAAAPAQVPTLADPAPRRATAVRPLSRGRRPRPGRRTGRTLRGRGVHAVRSDLAAGTGSLIAQRPGAESTGQHRVPGHRYRCPVSPVRPTGDRGARAWPGRPSPQLPPELIAALPVGPTLDPAAAAAPTS